jgi:hypothetical protein
MNEVTVSSSNDISYINTGDYGYVAGAEARIQKTTFNSDSTTLKNFRQVECSYLYSNQN